MARLHLGTTTDERERIRKSRASFARPKVIRWLVEAEEALYKAFQASVDMGDEKSTPIHELMEKVQTMARKL